MPLAPGVAPRAQAFRLVLLRSGALPGDPGTAAPLIEAFWDDRHQRASETERLALFDRLFGAPAGPQDIATGSNQEFEELLLNLCDALMKAVEGGSHARVRSAALTLAENLAQATNGVVQMLAGEILSSLSAAVAILNHPDLRMMLGGRTMWDAVASIDRRLKRPARPTLTHLRRGRAGMALLAWLADNVDRLDSSGGPMVAAGDLVVDAAQGDGLEFDPAGPSRAQRHEHVGRDILLATDAIKVRADGDRAVRIGRAQTELHAALHVGG
jgi:hypothetical protein